MAGPLPLCQPEVPGAARWGSLAKPAGESLLGIGELPAQVRCQNQWGWVRSGCLPSGAPAAPGCPWLRGAQSRLWPRVSPVAQRLTGGKWCCPAAAASR